MMIQTHLHSLTLWAVILAALAPLTAFGVILLFFHKHPKLSAGLAIAAVAITLTGALFLLTIHRHLPVSLAYTVNWMSSGDLRVPVGFLLDPLNLLMLVIVAGICFLVQIYSLGYMHGDPGFSRYYAYMSLFAWAMICLILSPTLIQLYIFWELVGLASYLLIGFWFEKFSASQAGKKAFVMTRLGDVSFLIGILLLWVHLGNLNLLFLDGGGFSGRLPAGFAAICAVLIFGGIVGKSAQFPLLTWLPDAMEGPTPVSALLHSATMVAAGVFLFARLFPFFSHSPSAMTLFLLIGTLSMLMASTMAMVSRDIKQVLAFSTISQLGFMIMALAAGGFTAGVLHLTTHAGFKALLFLCAGVFIHHYHTNDMFEIGENNARSLKVPMVALMIGGAALSGIWPFSGFFSKEMIFTRLAGLENPVWLAAGMLGAFLTAYYTFRMIFIVIAPPGRPRETPHPGTPTPRVMGAVLLVLAGITCVFGLFQDDIIHFLLGPVRTAAASDGGHAPMLVAASLGLGLAGIGLAWYEFGRAGASRSGFVNRLPGLATFLGDRWFLDRFYRRFLDIIVYRGFSFLCAQNDNKVIDGGVHALARAAVKTGSWLAHRHEAFIQYRLTTMLAVWLVLLVCFLF